jgi:hypothetical protein
MPIIERAGPKLLGYNVRWDHRSAHNNCLDEYFFGDELISGAKCLNKECQSAGRLFSSVQP